MQTNPTALHVVQLNDLRDHDDKPDCWCQPVECFDGDGCIWVHNSMDRQWGLCVVDDIETRVDDYCTCYLAHQPKEGGHG